MIEICFGSTKMEIFYQEKVFHTGKKIRKNDFAPSEKYACYVPDPEPNPNSYSNPNPNPDPNITPILSD